MDRRFLSSSLMKSIRSRIWEYKQSHEAMDDNTVGRRTDTRHASPRFMLKAVYFAAKCVTCGFSVYQQQLQPQLFTHSSTQHHDAQLGGRLTGVLSGLDVATVLLSAIMLLLMLVHPRRYHRHWQLVEAIYQVVTVQCVFLAHCVARPAVANVPVTVAVLSSLLPLVGHDMGASLVSNLALLPLWLAADFFVWQQQLDGGLPATAASGACLNDFLSADVCPAAGVVSVPPLGILVQGLALRLLLLLACTVGVTVSACAGLSTRPPEVEEDRGGEDGGFGDADGVVRRSSSAGGGDGGGGGRGTGVVERLEVWIRSRHGRALVGPLVYVSCGVYSVFAIVPLLPAMCRFGPMNVEAGAASPPAQVFGVFLAAWILSRSDFRTDWWQLSDVMKQQLREQRRRHSRLLVLTALEKHRAEAAVQQLQLGQEELSSLRDEHQKLLQQQQVLQAELQMALKSYVPSTVIDAGTPADRMLGMLAEMLEGGTPSLDSILFVQNALLSARNVYQPVDLEKQMQSSQLDEDISRMLVQQLTERDGSQTDFIRGWQDGQADMNGHHDPTASYSDDGSSASSDSVPPILSEHTGSKSRSFPNGSHQLLSKSAAAAAKVGSSLGGSDCDVALAGLSHSQRAKVRRQQRRRRLRDFGYDAAGLAAALRSICDTSVCIVEPVGVVRPPPTCKPTDDSSRMRGRSAAGAASLLHRAAVRPSAECALATAASMPSAARVGSFVPHQPAPVDERLRTRGGLSFVSGASSVSVAPPMFDEVERLLSTVDSWYFDAFELCKATHDHPLSTLAYYVMHSSGLMAHYKLSGTMVARFFRRIEAGYRDHPYHSRTHACNVLQVMHVLVHQGGLVPVYCDPLTMLACYISAACHDFEHAGVTNDFLVASNSTLALRYNDRSPQENHHLAATFSVLRETEHNFLHRLPKADFERMRKMMIELVLATDMKQHFSITSQFNTVHRLSVSNRNSERCSPCESVRQSNAGDSTGSPGGPLSEAPGSRGHSEVQMRTNSRLAMSRLGDPPLEFQFQPQPSRMGREPSHMIPAQPLDEAERVLSLQMALKCADLGHMAQADLGVHVKWVQCLEEEMFCQGDQEKALGLPVSPLFDRDKPGVTKSQIGFYEIVVIPLFKSFVQVFPHARPLLVHAMRDYQHWSSLSAPSAPPTPPVSKSNTSNH